MPTSEALLPSVTLRPIDSIPSDAPVRHVDQLDERALEQFLALRSGTSIDPGEASLEAGEVIVFTDYYRVERD
ncbi:hypothetical protein ACFQGT_16890 [Natrialbaceae archaeon GCM10025810]|uniref:hypothetical protein n=1 Tax=Halovalidus salilacus TaxID=3075124 RepID=UPI00361CEF12